MSNYSQFKVYATIVVTITRVCHVGYVGVEEGKLVEHIVPHNPTTRELQAARVGDRSHNISERAQYPIMILLCYQTRFLYFNNLVSGHQSVCLQQ